MIFPKSKALQKVAAALLILTVILVTIALVVIFTVPEPKAKGAIVTNGFGCSDIATSIFEKGGNAADAAIAALFCEGVSMPQSMGLGGGFLLTIYRKDTGEVWSLDSREVAPGAATEDMFQGNSTLSQRGGMSVGVPGELLGYWYLYEKFGGNLPWKDLIQPTIDLCRNGIYVTKFLDGVYKSRTSLLYNDPVLRDIFIDPETNETYVEGRYVKRLRLAETLQTIASEGGYALHNGSLTEGFVKDIRDKNGIITVEDMNNYKPRWLKSVGAKLLNNETLYTSPLPGSGLILTFILNILSNFIDIQEPNSITTHQRIVESFKFAYGKRTLLGDETFIDIAEVVADLTSKKHAEEIRNSIFDYQTFQDPTYYGANTTFVEDHGTAHISILAPNGDAVSVTSTINFLFGAGFASESTGIILNDEMDDFSSPNLISGFDIPPSPANHIAPGKRPLSSMCPSIIVDGSGDVQLVTGAAGGTKITTTIAMVIIKHLWYGMDLKSAVDSKRYHHQLFPMKITFEGLYATEVVADLTSKKHAEEIRNSIFDYQTFQDPTYYGANTTFVEDHGTAHISILAPNGDAVSVTSTINFLFGAGFASESTGIILNDEMDDFSSPNLISGFDIPPSPANHIAPGKRPLSSMCPSIIVDGSGDVQLVTGAAGGTKITTTIAMVIIKHLWYGMDLKSAVDSKRYHHQLFPMKITFEGLYATEDQYNIVEGLSRLGHVYNITDDDGFAAVTSISRTNPGSNQITGAYDRRRSGTISYIY